MKNIKYLIIVLVLTAVSGAAGFFWTKNNLSKQTNNSGSTVPTNQKAEYPKTIGNFLITDKEICKEGKKPIVYFFGSSSCPYCVWEKPVAGKVFALFEEQIVYKENFDSEKDIEVFKKYSDINPGYVPFLVLGCKYARVGAGKSLAGTEEEAKKLEEEALTAIVCKLTDNKPKEVCFPLKDKISEVK